MKFILGGEGWGGKRLPSNVRWIGHVATHQHNAVNCSARMVLNQSRVDGESRILPAHEGLRSRGCWCLSDYRSLAGHRSTSSSPGGRYLSPRRRRQLSHWLRSLDPEQARAIGIAMRQRALREHTYELRVKGVEAILTGEESPAVADADYSCG